MYEVRVPTNHSTCRRKPKAKGSPPFSLGIGESDPSLARTLGRGTMTGHVTGDLVTTVYIDAWDHGEHEEDSRRYGQAEVRPKGGRLTAAIRGCMLR